VIVILGLLMGIMIPVVSRVRQAAYEADTRSRINVIADAINRYYSDFQAYPGVFSNAEITAPGVVLAGPPGLPGSGSAITMTENCVLSLMGGVTVTGSGPTFMEGDVGRGPLSFNPGNPKRYNSYIGIKEAGLRDKPWTGPVGTGRWQGRTTGAVDSVVPEFMDQFVSQPMPIVYLRARVGASGIADVFPYDATRLDVAQYNWTHLGPYFDWTTTAPTFPTKVNATPDDMFRSQTLSGVPQRKDTFWLISAGKDRKYGTRDDIAYGLEQ
jgi:type II secretory pathway pseudopilin PulG